MNHKIITFESTCEGAGKTTQALRLVKAIRDSGHNAVYVKFPGGPFRDLILDYYDHIGTMEPKAHLLVQAADFAQSVTSTIKPALDRGSWVICDRYIDSTFVYQCWGQGLDMSEVNKVIELAVGPYKPVRTLLLDIDQSHATERLTLREGPKRIAQRADNDFVNRIRKGYLSFHSYHEHRFRLINGEGSEEEVHERIKQSVKDLIKDL